MVKLNLGDTYNDLTDEQFKILGDLTEGYSGSDIYNLTQDAIYGPLRKLPISQKDSKWLTAKKINEVRHIGEGQSTVVGSHNGTVRGDTRAKASRRQYSA